MATASRTRTSKKSPKGRPRLISSAGLVVHVRKPGATATEDDRNAAMAYLGDIYTNWWNPWRRDDEADAIQAAHAVLDQWTETGGATQEDIDAWMAAGDEYARQEHRRHEDDRARRKVNYDADQEADRLALLEAGSILPHVEEERTSLISGLRFPAMATDRRTSKIARLEEEVAQRTRRVDELRARVPNPELVVDKQGWLPADRRAWRKFDFEWRRRSAVIGLRQERLDAQAELEATPKGQRRDLLARVRGIQAKLDFWLAIPEPEVQQMCSECATPLVWHVWSTGGLEALVGYGPCPAYPGQRAIYRRVIAMLEASSAQKTPKDISPPEKKRHDPRTKAQLLEELDRLQAQIAEKTQP